MNREQINAFVIKETATVVEAMQKIDSNAKGILFVVDEVWKLSGVVTDGDIRRWLIKTGKLQSSVCDIMNCSPKVIYQKDSAMAQDMMHKYTITALPVITRKGILKDIIFAAQDGYIAAEQEKDLLTEVPVVIMAGGKGTRLYPYTKVLPKPLIPIGDIPIMERIIDRFCMYGITDYYATVNYQKGMIKAYFSEVANGYHIRYVEEDEPLGTAGSLRLISERFQNPFIVTNCDILIDADYSDIYKFHNKTGNSMTIVSALKNIVVPYGVIHSKEDGLITQMEEKPKLSYFINTGMYILNPDVLDRIPQDTFFHMTDLADALMEAGKKVGMYPISEDSFLDMGEFEEMRRMEQKLNLKVE